MSTTDHAPRIRLITNSPADEFASRPGSTRPISDQLAALILSRKETRKITRGKILLTINGEARRYGSPDCLISQPVMAGKEVIVAYNPQSPQRVHIFDDKGRYIETAPCELQATWLQSDAESKQALADARRAMTRAETQLQELHRPDTAATIQRTIDNAAKMQRAVVTLPPVVEDQETRRDPRREAGALETSVTREMSRQERAIDVIARSAKKRADNDADLAARAEAAIEEGI